jgi:type I restriction enzyme, S subunit
MTNAPLIRMTEICSMTTGKLDSNAAVKDGEYPFFTCAQETFQINTYAFDTEAVLLGGNNANGIFPLKYYSGKFNAYQRTYILETRDSNVLLTRYLYYALMPALGHFRNASIGAATQYLTKPILDNFRIRLLDISTQRKIVSIISAYDDLIENNRRRIELLEQSARLLYKEWFVSLRFPGHEHVKVKDGIPDGWEQSVFGNVGEDIRDSVKPEQVEPQTPYIGLEHIPRRSITLIDWGSAEDVSSNKFRFVERDILFGKIRPYFHKVGFALTDGITSSDTIVMRPTNDKFYAYLLMTASSDQFVRMVSQTVKEGSKMPRANWDVMQQYPLLIPPDSLLSTFSEFIDNAVMQLKTLAFQNKKLQQARDLLLPRLMNGEIPV